MLRFVEFRSLALSALLFSGIASVPQIAFSQTATPTIEATTTFADPTVIPVADGISAVKTDGEMITQFGCAVVDEHSTSCSVSYGSPAYRDECLDSDILKEYIALKPRETGDGQLAFAAAYECGSAYGVAELNFSCRKECYDSYGVSSGYCETGMASISVCDGSSYHSYGRCVCPDPVCGNGEVEGVVADGDREECDDGNTTSGDGCSSTCQLEYTPTPPTCVVLTPTVVPGTPTPAPTYSYMTPTPYATSTPTEGYYTTPTLAPSSTPTIEMPTATPTPVATATATF